MLELAASGSAVIMISQDLEEVFAIAHKIAVLPWAVVCRMMPASEVTAEQIGVLMGGGADRRGAAHDFYDPRKRYLHFSVPLVDTTGVDHSDIVRWATIFAVLGYDPNASLYQFFIAPLSRPDQVADLFVKSLPIDNHRHWAGFLLPSQCLEYRCRGADCDPVCAGGSRAFCAWSSRYSADASNDSGGDFWRHGMGADPGCFKSAF